MWLPISRTKPNLNIFHRELISVGVCIEPKTIPPCRRPAGRVSRRVDQTEERWMYGFYNYVPNISSRMRCWAVPIFFERPPTTVKAFQQGHGSGHVFPHAKQRKFEGCVEAFEENRRTPLIQEGEHRCTHALMLSRTCANSSRRCLRPSREISTQ